MATSRYVNPENLLIGSSYWGNETESAVVMDFTALRYSEWTQVFFKDRVTLSKALDDL
jgi:hypothetical protein